LKGRTAMTLLFENESDKTLSFNEEETAKKVMEASLDYIGFPYETQINLILTNNEGIHRINKKFRNIDRETDVLSFPAVEYEKAGDFSGFDEMDEFFDLESGEFILGDMMISVERVLSQAEEYGHSELREYAFLIAHSMLHLFGYDHMNEEEAEQMERMQEEILDGLGIRRA